MPRSRYAALACSLALTAATVLLPGAYAVAAPAAIVYVAPDGDDANPGTETQPVRTLSRARDLVRGRNQGMTGDLTVRLAGGTYRLSTPLRLDGRDSGTNGYSVNWEAAPGTRPVISGGVRVTGWRLADAQRNVWSAQAPSTLVNTRQLYVDGVRAQRARGPAPVTLTSTATGYTASSNAMASWRNPADVEFVYTGGDTLWSAKSYGLGGWTEPRCPVGSISGVTITMAQPCWDNSTKRPVDPNHPTRSLHEVGRPDLYNKRAPAYLENAYELLDQPGEWYLDRSAKAIHYIPRTGQDLTTAQVEAPVLEHLVQGWGSASDPLHHVTFRGLQFSYATWLRPSTGEGLSEIQATYSITGTDGYKTQGLCQQYAGGTCPFAAWTKTPGNVSFRYAQHIRFLDGAFVHLGGAGLDLDDGAQQISVTGNVFTDISGTGVHIGDVDKPQATGAHVTSGVAVRNNHLYALPLEYRGGVAIFNGYTRDTVISNNQIDHTAYTGISTGWGGWLDKVQKPGVPNLSANNRISDNLIFDHMMVLSDGAGIYNNGVAGPALSGGLRLIDNVIRDQRGPGHAIYMDNGSYGITANGNVMVGNGHDWAGLRRNYAAGDGSYSPMDIRDNYWQQGDPDRTVPGATIRRNRITATVRDAPASIVDSSGLQPAYRDILSWRFGAPAAPEPPERVAAFAGDRFAYVSWLEPVVDGGTEVASYTVAASTGQQVTVLAKDFRRAGYVKVPGLGNGAAVTFTVTASNANGTGPVSLRSASVTPKASSPTRPGAPNALTVHPGDGTVAVLFAAPATDGGSPVTAYQVRVTSGGVERTVTGRLVLLRKANVPVVLGGLTNGQSYVVEVRAENVAGTGPAAQSSPVVPRS